MNEESANGNRCHLIVTSLLQLCSLPVSVYPKSEIISTLMHEHGEKIRELLQRSYT